MKKILYIVHIDWDWIKQRPQYVAEGLARSYDLLILYGHSPKRFNMVKNSRKGLSLKAFFPIPFFLSNDLIFKIHKIYLKIYFSYIIKRYDPEYVWVTFPLLYDYLPNNLNSKIIYDCMDDALGFTENKQKQEQILEMEKNLITNSWKIFSSSQYLAKKLNQRKECSNKLVIIPNGFESNIQPITNKNNEKKKHYKIGYVGTISEWFDFEALKYTLKHLKNIEYHIIGPITAKLELNRKERDKIKLYGVVEHEKLYSYIKNFDCLIMPFKLNELIYSVDPVKLYEYINFNKPIISIYYKGLDRFEPYTYFYNNNEELLSVIKDLLSNGFDNKYSSVERVEFLNNNTWTIRVENMIKELKK